MANITSWNTRTVVASGSIGSYAYPNTPYYFYIYGTATKSGLNASVYLEYVIHPVDSHYDQYGGPYYEFYVDGSLKSTAHVPSVMNDVTMATYTKTLTANSSGAFSTTSVSGKWYRDGSSGTPPKDLTISATFSIPNLATYTVAYNANGGTGTVSSQTKIADVPLTLASSGYTKDGFTLAGWNDQNTGTDYSLGGTYQRNGSALMYARWTANTYTVSFNANGGSGSQSSMTKTGGVALTLPSSTTFTYTGRHITKWRLNSASGTEYNLGGSYTTNADATFYAKWEYNTYTVVFNANGGSGTMANESMTYGTYKNLTSNAFTKSGHRFLGWATSSSGAVVYTDGQSVRNLTTTNNGTVTLYAVWQSAGVRVKHNGEWKTGQVYVKHNGEWKIGRVYAKHNGSWKEGT